MVTSSSPASPLSRHLLIPDRRPPTTSSSTVDLPLSRKRTRHQPNLSDCHCCGRRVNPDNPRDRIQPLDSVWRIVLLCRKCRNNLHSGHTCPYCFQHTGSSEDLSQCSTCQRKIHNVCVRIYGESRPWCYLGDGLEGFGVCIDCWVPELFKSSVNVHRRHENRTEAKHSLEKVGKEQAMETVGLENGKESATAELARGVDAEGINLVLLAYKRDKHRRAWKLNNENDKACSETCHLQKDVIVEVPMNKTADASEGLVDFNANPVDLYASSHRFGRFYKRARFRHKVYQENDSVVMSEDPNDVNGFNLGQLTYKCDNQRTIWDIRPVNEKKTVMCEANLHRVNFNLNLDDIRATDPLKSGTNASDGSLDVIGQCSDGNGLNLGLSFYKRDKKRRIWDIQQLNQENNVVSEANPQKVTRSPMKDDLNLSKVSSDFSCPCNRSNQALLPYKRDRNRKIWSPWQLTDKNAVVCECGLEKIKFNLHLDDGSRASSPLSTGVVLSEGSVCVNGLCYDVDGLNPGLLLYKRDKTRRVWDVWQLNDEKTVVSNLSSQKVKFHLHLADVENSSSMKYGADISKLSNDIPGSYNDVKRLNIGPLPYKRVEKREMWDIWKLNDENTIRCHPVEGKLQLLHNARK